MKIISWNTNRKVEAWSYLMNCDADIALLQEAVEPPLEVKERFRIDPSKWETSGYQKRKWRAAVAILSDQYNVSWIPTAEPHNSKKGELEVSRFGTLAVAQVKIPGHEPLTVVSMYAVWETLTKGSFIYADASVHRIISDLSTLIGSKKKHRIIASGDLNILKGYGEHKSSYMADRYKTVFDRFSALGLDYIGPQYPNGRQSNPWPDELPLDSKNVPTYHTPAQGVTGATRQLDFVFASASISDQVEVSALNSEEAWGVSDHCKIEIKM